MLAAAPAKGGRLAACSVTSQPRLLHPSSAFSGRNLQAHGHLRHKRARSRMSQRVSAVLEISTDNFDAEVAQAELPVLLDFWANWCGPCKLVLPSIEWAEKEYEGQLKVVKVEADSNQDLVEKYKVYGLPTIILVRDGEKIPGTHHEGAITQAKLVAYLDKHGFSKASD